MHVSIPTTQRRFDALHVPHTPSGAPVPLVFGSQSTLPRMPMPIQRCWTQLTSGERDNDTVVLGCVDLHTDRIGFGACVASIGTPKEPAPCPKTSIKGVFKLLRSESDLPLVGDETIVSPRDVCARARKFYNQHVPKEDQYQELNSFKCAEIGDGVVPQLRKSDAPFKSSDCLVHAVVGAPGQAAAAVDVFDPANPHSVGFGCAPHQSMRAWLAHGGDPSVVPMKVADDRVANVNELLAATTLVHRALRWKHAQNSGMGIEELAELEKAEAQGGEILNQIDYVIVSELGGTLSSHPASALSMPLFNAPTPSSEHKGWFSRAPAMQSERRIPQAVHEQRCVDDKDVTDSGIRKVYLSNTVLYRPSETLVGEGSEGLRLPCKIVMLPEAEMDDILHRPCTYGDGNVCSVQAHDHVQSEGKVPICVHVKNVELQPLSSQLAAMSSFVCGMENLTRYSHGSLTSRRLKPLCTRTSSSAVSCGSVPHSVAVRTSNPLAAYKDADGLKVSTLFDFTCAVSNLDDCPELLVQTDPPMFSANTPPIGQCADEWASNIISAREAVRASYAALHDSLDDDGKSGVKYHTPLSVVPRRLSAEFSNLTSDAVTRSAAFLTACSSPIQLMTKHVLERVLGDDELSPQPTRFVSSKYYDFLGDAFNGALLDTPEKEESLRNAILPDADRETLYIVNSNAGTVLDNEASAHASSMYKNLAYLAQTFVDANEDVGGTATFSALRPTKHCSQLGNVKSALPVAAGLHGRPTFNRAGIVVQVEDSVTQQHDALLMLIDRSSKIATDPELFSVDPRMDPDGLYNASSVRSCLGQDTNPDFKIKSIRHLNVTGRKKFYAGKLGLVDGNHFVAFTVDWQAGHDMPVQRDDFYVCCANKLRSQNDDSFTNETQSYARTFPVTNKTNGSVYATHNPAWRLHRITPGF